MVFRLGRSRRLVLLGRHTLAELRDIDAGKGQKIPLLEEVIELVRDRVGLVIETKQYAFPLVRKLGGLPPF